VTTGRRAAAVALALLAVVGAFLLGGQLLRPATPSDTSAEAGFARDMQTHHNQAVEMALVVREKSTEPVLRSVAYDIATSQSQQSGQMFAWLTMWGLTQTGSGPHMTWMSGSDGGHEGMSGAATGAPAGAGSGMLLPDGRMPGMASSADLARLRSATGRNAEVLFLRLMVVHHRAGVVMARAIEQRTSRPEVLSLARSVVSAQTSEISQMDDLLSARGAAAA